MSRIRIQTSAPAGWRLLGTLRRSRYGLLSGTALSAAALSVVALSSPAAAQPAPNARPLGGVVTAGSASIATAPTSTTITQSSQRAAVDWHSFDVGSQQSVAFQQPSASAVTLNRVNSPNPSAIAGKITANGTLVLVNQSGVIFYPGAQVDAQSAIISAAGITNKNFMAGHMVFDQAARPDAAVVNQGTITVAQAGLAALVAPQVANAGVINARLGHVVLAGAAAATLDMYGDGLVSIDVTQQVTQAPVGPDGKPVTALVTNTGVVRADGGTVQITAAAADGVVQTLVRAGGHIQADSVGTRTGSIVIDGTGGALVVEGSVKARGLAAGTVGGEIQLATTGSVTLAATARVDASGRAGGGTVAVGTNLARARGGAGVTPTVVSSAVTLAKGAKVKADARDSGAGGTVTLLSSGTTDFQGRISARGGSLGGDGGSVEISGRAVALGGTADVSAPAGSPWRAGSILLDPLNLDISTTQPAGFTATTPAANEVAATTDPTGNDYVTPAQLAALNGNVTLQAVHDIVVSSNVALTTAGQSFTLDAGHDVTVNAGVTISTAGDIDILAGDAAMTTAGGVAATPDGTIRILNTAVGAPTVITTTGALSLTSGTTDINLGGQITAASLVVNAGAQLGQTATDATSGNANVLSLSGALSGTATAVNLAGANQITALGALTAGTGGIAITEATGQALAVAGLVKTTAAGQTIALTADSVTIPVGGAVNAGATGLVALAPTTAGRGISVASANVAGDLNLLLPQLARITAGTLQLGSATSGAIALGTAGAADGINFSGQLSLLGTGSVTEASDAVLTLGTLAGSAAGFTLAGANAIGTLGGLTATSGGIGITEAAAQGLTVAGLVTTAAAGQTIALTADSLSIPTGGSLVAAGTAGVVALAPATAAHAISITNAAAEALNTTNLLAGDLDRISAGTLQLGSAAGGAITFGAAAGAIDLTGGAAQLTLLSGGAVTEFAGASLSVGTLAGQVASMTLAGANHIATLGTIATTGGLSINAVSPTVAGKLSDPTAITLTTPGDLAINGTIAAPLVTLNATGFVTEGAGGTIGNATLTGSAEGFTLTGANSFGTLGVLTATSDSIFVNVAPGGTLTLNGAVTATGKTIGLTADEVSFGAGGSLHTGTGLVSLAPATSSHEVAVIASVIAPANALTLQTVDLPAITAGTLQLGSATTAGGIVLGSAGDALDLTAFPTLSLLTSGAVTQGGTLRANTLTGGAATLALEAANTIATLGAFGAGGAAALTSFTLNDSGPLSVAGGVTASTSIGLTTTGALSVPGTLSAPAISLTSTGGAVSLAGTLDNAGAASTSVALTAATTINQTGGVLNTATLSATAGTGGAGGVTLTAGSNTVGTLANSSAIGAFTLAGTGALNVAGSISGTTSIGLSTSGALSVPGTLSSPVIALTSSGDAISLAGTLSNAGAQSTSIALNAGTDITQTGGVLKAATLSAKAGTAGVAGAVALAAGANTVTTLSNSSAIGGFTLGNTGALTVAGTLTGGTGIRLSSTGMLTAGGVLTAPTIDLTSSGGAISLGGTLWDGAGTPSTSIGLAAATDITQTGGTLQAVFLSAQAGTAGVAGAVALATGANTVTVLSDSSAIGGFTLSNTGALAVAGLSDGTSIGLTSTGLLTATGTLTAPTIDLTSSGGAIALGNISLGATLWDGAGTPSTSIALSAATGITQTGGVLNAATLAANSTGGTVALTAGANSVGTLGGSSAGTGFTFGDTGTLSVPIAVSAGTGIGLRSAGQMTVGGILTAPSIALTSTGGGISLGGKLWDGAATPSTTIALSAAGDVSQTAGVINTDTLGVTAATGSVALTAGINAIGTLSAASASSSFGLADTGSLAIAAALSAAHVELTIAGLLSETSGGAITATALTGSAGTVALGGANLIATLDGFSSTSGFALTDEQSLTVAGPHSDPTSIALTVTTGDLLLQGVLSDGVLAAGQWGQTGTLALNAAGSIVQSAAGTLSAVTLTGSAGGSVSLAAGLDTISTLAGFAAATSTFTFYDSDPLTVTDTVAAGTTLTLLNDAPTVTGATLAAGGTIVLAPLTAGTPITIGGANFGSGAIFDAPVLQFGQPGTATIPTGAITIDGALTPGGQVTTLRLETAGAIAEFDATSVIDVATLAGSALGTVDLHQSNTIDTLAGFTSVGGFTLTDSKALAVLGTLSDATSIGVSVTGDLTLGNGTIATATAIGLAASTLSLTASGNVTETANTSLTGAVLTGSAGGSAALTAGSNIIGTLNGFASKTGFALKDAQALLLTGTVSDPVGIVLTTTTGDLGLQGILTNGTFAAATGWGQTPTLTLNVAGSILETSPGTLSAGTLTGSAGGSVALADGLNSVSTLGSFSSATGFTLTNEGALTVAGTLRDTGGTLELTNAGSLTVSGTIAAPTVSLAATAGDITQTGGLIEASSAATLLSGVPDGTLTLTANGAIAQQGGRIWAGRLTGSANGQVDLGHGDNVVGTLGGFSAGIGGFTLSAAYLAEIIGPVSTAGPIVILGNGGGSSGDPVSPGTLFIGGNISGGLVSLSYGGAIDQTGGAIQATELTGSVTTSATFDSPTNAIGTLGNYAAPSGFRLADAAPLTIPGTVSATGATIRLLDDSVTFATGGLLTSPGGVVALAPLNAGDTLTVAGGNGATGASSVVAGDLILGLSTFTDPLAPSTIRSGALALGALAQPGTFNLSGTTIIDLESSGDISQTGYIVQPNGTLIGNAANITLAGGGVLVGTGPTATLTGVSNEFGTLGNIAASGTSFILDSAGQDLAVVGTLGTTGTLQLGVLGGGLNLAATSRLGTPATSATLLADHSITEANGAVIATATLTGSAGQGASFASAGNAIGTLNGFASKTGFALKDAQALLLTGTVSDPVGIVLTTTTGDLGLQGILTNGTFAAATGWGQTPTLTLNVAGSILETSAGTLSAGTLTGSAGGSVALADGLNSVSTLGSFSSATGFTLANEGALTVAGPVTDNTSVGVSNAGSLTLAGSLTAPVIHLAATALEQNGTRVAGAAPSDIRQTFGPVNAGTLGTLTLNATGAIVQTGGSLVAGTLSGAAGGSVELTQALNAIGTLAGFTADTGSLTPGGFTLVDSQGLKVTGILQDPLLTELSIAGSLDLNAATLRGPIVGGVTFLTGAVSLHAGNQITQEGGAILAGTLIGTSELSSIVLDSTANQIGTLAAVTAPGSIWLTDSTPVTVLGTVASAQNSIRLRDDVFTFANGGLLQAATGTVALAPYAAGDSLTVAGGNGGDDATSVTAPLLLIGEDPFAATPSLTLAGSLDLPGSFNLSGIATLDLVATGNITQTGTIVMPSGTLIGSGADVSLLGGATITGSGGSIVLTGVTNRFGTLGDFTATGGTFTLASTGTQGLTVLGTIASGGTADGTISLGVTTGGLSLTAAAALDAATLVSVTTDGAIAEADGAVIATGTLSGSAGLGVSLLSTGNAIGTLAGFAADTHNTAGTDPGLRLRDRQTLVVTGPVSDPFNVQLTTGSGDISLRGIVSSGSLVSGGWEQTGTLVLDAAGSIIETAAGTLSAATLTGSAGGSVALADGLNSFSTLNGFASNTGFSLANGGTLVVTGGVTDGVSVGIVNAGEVTLAGAVTAPVIGISATGSVTGITQTSGLLDASGTLTLTATGTIAQTGGAIDAGLLTGSAGGSVDLTSTTNAIGTLGSFTGDTLSGVSSPGHFALTDSETLDIVGPVSDPYLLTITIQAPTAGGGTSSPDLHLMGTLSAGTLDLVTGGTLYQDSGAILGQTLIGNAAAATLDMVANSIGTLGNFTAPGGFLFTDSAALIQKGTVTVGTGATIRLRADTVTFANGGLLSAPSGIVALAPLAIGDAMNLTGNGGASLVTADQLIIGGSLFGAAQAGSLTIGGTFDLSGARVLDLLASGDITQTGAILQPNGTLTGSGANVSLLGVANEFGTIDTLAATGGLGLATAGQGLVLTDTLQAGSSIALSVTGGGVTLGTAATAATLAAPSLVAITTDGTVSEPNGVIDTATLTLAAASATLSGGNAIGTLGGVTTPGGLALNDTTGLVVAAPLSSGAVALAIRGNLGLAANVTAPSIALAVSGAVNQTAGSVTTTLLSGSAAAISLGDLNSIATLGATTLGGALVLDNAPDLTLAGGLTANTVQITEAGNLLLSGDVTATSAQLAVTGSLAQNAGTLILGTLAGSAASVTLPDANQIATIGALASQGTVNLDNTPNLALTGMVSAAGSVALTVGGNLTETGAGSIVAPSLVGSAAQAVLGGANLVPSLAGFSTPGGLVFQDGVSLGVNGPVTASSIALDVTGDLALDTTLTGTLVRLVASGAITQPGGALLAGTLAGSAASASFGQPNSIATLADFASAGALSLTDATALGVTGPVTAATAQLVTGGALNFTGDLTTGTLDLTVNGSVAQQGGSLTAGTLTGSAVGAAQFGPDAAGPVANIGVLGPFSVYGSGSQLYLYDNEALVLRPPLSAGAIAITAPGQVTLEGGTLTTGGVPSIGPSQPVTSVNSTGGTLTTSGSTITVLSSGGGATFTQTGTTTVVPPAGSATGTLIIRSGSTSAGQINLNQLVAPNIDLILSMGSGIATGAVDVGNLLLLGSGGSAALSGTVQGFGGKVAARVSTINPTANRNYQINACPLQSVNCLILSVQAVPIPSIQSDLVIGSAPDNRDDPDLLLPNIAAKDY